MIATELSRFLEGDRRSNEGARDNPLNSWRARSGRRSAYPQRAFGRARALLLALFVPAAACLVPQSVDPDSSKLHVPPSVVIEAVDPQLATSMIVLQHGSIDAAASCSCRVVLDIPEVEEDDPTVTLEVRWFVDYDPNSPLTQRPAVPSQFLNGSFDSTAVLRQGPSLPFDLGALGVSDGVHVVDMVVAEQGAFDDTNTTFPHRAMLSGYASAAFRFVVSVETDNDSACRSDPPWARVCAGSGP